jgi:hypothetical protein
MDEIVHPGEPTLRQVALDESHPHQKTAEMALLDNVAQRLHVAEFMQFLMTESGRECVPNFTLSDQDIQRERLKKRLRDTLVIRASSEHPSHKQ